MIWHHHIIKNNTALLLTICRYLLTIIRNPEKIIYKKIVCNEYAWMK